MNKIISNRKKDREKKLSREEPPDDEDVLEIPVYARSPEDLVLEKIVYEELKRELQAWGFFRSDDEFALCETAHVVVAGLEDLRERLRIPIKPSALRKRISRANKKIVAARDALFTFILLNETIPPKGRLSQFPEYWGFSKRWLVRAKKSVRGGVWLDGKAPGRNMVAARPLTTGFHDAPSHMYLVATHKDCRRVVSQHNEQVRLCAERLYNLPPNPYTIPEDVLPYMPRTRDDDITQVAAHFEVTQSFERGSKPLYLTCLLKTYPTELQGLTKALYEVPEDYYTWLVSDSLPYMTKGEPVWDINAGLSFFH